TTYHHEVLVAEEEAVAGRAPPDAVTGHPGFLGPTHLLILGSGSDDDRPSPITVPAVRCAGLCVTVHINAPTDPVCADGTYVCVLPGPGEHQVWALDAAWNPGEVFDVGGGHECTAMAHGTGDGSGGEACPAGIDGRSVAGWAGPYDEQLVGGISELSGGGHLRLDPVHLEALGRCRDEQLGYELLDAGFNVVANG